MQFLLLMLVSLPVFAQENIDVKLAGYIQEFNLKTLTAPAERKQKLFIIGRNLFHEKGLSGNNNIRCEDCHHPRVGTHDGIPLSVGEGSFGLQFGTRLRMQGTGKGTFPSSGCIPQYG